MKAIEMQLTYDEQGHTLHNTQVFSPDDQWIVYDSRNKDTEIGRTKTIDMVHVDTKEIKQLYHTGASTPYGPGVGAASFSPIEDRVIFIHGVRNSNEAQPYGLTRRTGVSIDVQHPFQPHFMDARDITPPLHREHCGEERMRILGAEMENGLALPIMITLLNNGRHEILRLLT